VQQLGTTLSVVPATQIMDPAFSGSLSTDVAIVTSMSVNHSSVLVCPSSSSASPSVEITSSCQPPSTPANVISPASVPELIARKPPAVTTPVSSTSANVISPASVPELIARKPPAVTTPVSSNSRTPHRLPDSDILTPASSRTADKTADVQNPKQKRHLENRLGNLMEFVSYTYYVTEFK